MTEHTGTENETTTEDDPQTGISGDGSQADDAPDSAAQGLREARDRYRTERDTAREELAAAQARIDRMHRTEVERLAADVLAMPGDFWLSENELSEYLTDAGDVDADRVREDARLLLEERPRLGKRDLPVDTTQGRSGGNGKREPSWGALLSG